MKLTTLCCTLSLTAALAAQGGTPCTVTIETSKGEMQAILFDQTPEHKQNFLKLAREGYYNNLLFHRVINHFMLQTGDPDSKDAPAGKTLGMGGPGYTLPAEIHYPELFHQKGALAAARQGDQVNPEKRSSGSQFYIVQGNKISDTELAELDKQMQQKKQLAVLQELFTSKQEAYKKVQAEQGQTAANLFLKNLREEAAAKTPEVSIPAEVKQQYSEVGGTPFLDGDYTVFGQIISGLNIIDEIASVATDGNDRPKSNVYILKITENAACSASAQALEEERP